MVRSRARSGRSGFLFSLIRPQSPIASMRQFFSSLVWGGGGALERSVMLKVKAMAFNELVKAKAKIEAELELRAAKERSSLIEAIGRLRRLSAAQAHGSRTSQDERR